MPMLSFVIVVIVGGGLSLFPRVGAAQVVLNDASLASMARLENPAIQKIDGEIAMTKGDQSIGESQFDPRLAASYSYASSKEDAIIQFIPVFRPEKNFRLGLEQKLPFGVKVSTGVFGTQLNAPGGMINNATQVGAQFGLEFDIWKNFLGRLDRKDLRNRELNHKVAELQGGIDKASFVYDIRKLYWSLVATELSLNLSKGLIQTAEKQLKDAKRRARDGAGDLADVSRNKAQVLSRKSAVLFFSYQKESLLSRLKSLLPGLEGKNLLVGTGEKDAMETAVRQCMVTIASKVEVDSSYSNYSKIITLLDEQKTNAIELAEATDAMDIRLQAKYQASGVSQSHSEAFDRLSEDFKNGYQVGLSVNIPLGGDIRRARKSRVLATHHQMTAQKEALRLRLIAEHEKAQKALQLLGQASLSQEGMIKNLSISLKQSQRKYRQARIPLNTLILEQDHYFNAELQLIETKRQILDFLFDYFKIFPQHPCSINSKNGGLS